MNWTLKTNENLYKDLKILCEVDVLVVGGGPAGIAAATTAAKNGFNTLLVEKYGFCGGSAVAGLSATICGIYATNADNSGSVAPKQLVYGFTDDFLKAMKQNGGLTGEQIYGNTYVNAHESRVYKKTADMLITNAGAKILYHTNVIGTIVYDNIISGVVVSSALGLGIIKAKRTIDSSGNAAVVSYAGGDFTCGANEVVQNPTIIFKISNINSKKFWSFYGADTICSDEFTDKLINAEKDYQVVLPRKKIWVFKTIQDSEIYINATAISHESWKLNMIDPEHFTYSEISARKQMEDYFRFFKEQIPGCENAYIGEVAAEVGVRQTRSIKGKYTLKNTDVEQCKKFDDGIVKSSWPIELHKGERPKLHWLIDDYYEIPFRCLLPEKLDNVLVAGRCLSAEHEALASARVTAQCFEYGRAAALGVVVSLRENINSSQVCGKMIKEMMERK